MAQEIKLRARKENHRPGWKKIVMLERRKTAEARQGKRNKYTPTEQLRMLDIRLGVNVGAQKERARLTALLTTAQRVN